MYWTLQPYWPVDSRKTLLGSAYRSGWVVFCRVSPEVIIPRWKAQILKFLWQVRRVKENSHIEWQGYFHFLLWYTGPDICNKKFLSTSVLLGILSSNVENGYNLINSPMHAREAGLNFIFDDDEMDVGDDGIQNVVKISVRNEVLPSVSIQGTYVTLTLAWIVLSGGMS